MGVAGGGVGGGGGRGLDSNANGEEYIVCSVGWVRGLSVGVCCGQSYMKLKNNCKMYL
jgi:hypothetical protein